MIGGPLGFALVATLAFVVLVLVLVARKVNAKRQRKLTSAPQVEDYYDKECMGVVEVLSGRKHVFPNELIQQIDVTVDKHQPQARIAVHVTAEFNLAEFRFSAQQIELFLDTMQAALADFQASKAREQLRLAMESGATTTIYVSQDYADFIDGPPTKV